MKFCYLFVLQAMYHSTATVKSAPRVQEQFFHRCDALLSRISRELTLIHDRWAHPLTVFMVLKRPRWRLSRCCWLNSACAGACLLQRGPLANMLQMKGQLYFVDFVFAVCCGSVAFDMFGESLCRPPPAERLPAVAAVVATGVLVVASDVVRQQD